MHQALNYLLESNSLFTGQILTTKNMHYLGHQEGQSGSRITSSAPEGGATLTATQY